MIELNTDNVLFLIIFVIIVSFTSYLYIELKKLKNTVNMNTENIKQINNLIKQNSKKDVIKPTKTVIPDIMTTKQIYPNMNNSSGYVSQVGASVSTYNSRMKNIPTKIKEKPMNKQVLSESESLRTQLDKEDHNNIINFLTDVDNDKKVDKVDKVEVDEVDKVEVDEVDKVEVDEVNKVEVDEVNKVEEVEVDEIEVDEVEVDEVDKVEEVDVDKVEVDEIEVDEETLNNMSVKELRILSNKKGLIKSGTKNELIERLLK